MIANQQEFRTLVTQLGNSTWLLANLGVMFESGLVDELREPRTADELAARIPSLPRRRIECVLGAAAALGVVVVEERTYRLAEGMGCFVTGPLRAVITGDLRMHVMQPHAFLDSATTTPPTRGWAHTDRKLLESQGDASAGFAPALKMMIAPMLGDLAARLERPGARFLDVGVGVGALAVAMARAWPTLSVVGIDPAGVSLAIARERVASAGMADRIELRETVVDRLVDRDAFDLAWFPIFFIDETRVPTSLSRLHDSLHDGGWILVPVLGNSADARHDAVSALITELWGGPQVSPEQVETLLGAAGFSEVRRLPGPPFGPSLVVART